MTIVTQFGPDEPRYAGGKVGRLCKLCEAPFTTKTPIRIYCCRKCGEKHKNMSKDGTLDRYNRLTGKTEFITTKCEECGKNYSHKQANGKFCSARCGNNASYEKRSARWILKANYSPKLYLQRRYYGIKADVKKGKRVAASKHEFSLTLQSLFDMWDNQKGLCALTGFKMTHLAKCRYLDTNISIDRIDSDGPYSKSNTRLVCFTANMLKRKLTDNQLLEWCQAIIKTLGITLK